MNRATFTMFQRFHPSMNTLATLLTGILVTLPALDAANAANPAKPDVDKHIRYQRIQGQSPIRQILDVYYNKAEANKKRPVVLWIHGGAWKFGNKTHSIDPKAKVFVNKGYVLVAINYQFHPKVTWKEQATDVATAAKWITQNISKYGGDPKRIALMGHSAGAHLAALTGADPTYLKSVAVPSASIKAVVLLDGAGYDLPAVMKTSQGQHLKLYQEVFGKDLETLKAASPIYYFKKGRACPHYLIIPVSSRAITISQSNNLAAAIKKSGGHAEVYVAKNRTHMTLNQKIGNPDDAPTEKILSFLKTHL